MRYPPLRYYLERVLLDMGGISHWAAKEHTNTIPRKSQDNPGTIREIFVFVFFLVYWFFWP